MVTFVFEKRSYSMKPRFLFNLPSEPSRLVTKTVSTRSVQGIVEKNQKGGENLEEYKISTIVAVIVGKCNSSKYSI